MKKFLKLTSLFCTVVLLAMTFFGCQTQTASSSSSATTATTEPTSPVNLRMSWWGADTRHGPFVAALNAYKILHPKVTVTGEYQAFTGYQTKMMTQLAAGTAPDIIVVDGPWVPELSKNDFFVDLSKQPLFNSKTMDPKLLKDYGTFNSKLIAVPMGVQCLATMINVDAATKFNLDITKDFTWDSLITAGKKLHDSNPSAYLIVDNNQLNLMVKAILKETTGKQVVGDDYTLGFTVADLTKAYQWVADAYTNNVFQPAATSVLFSAVPEQNPDWIKGNFVMWLDWSGLIVRAKSTVPKSTVFKEMTYPQVASSPKDGAALVRPIFMGTITKTSTNVTEAVKFLSWFLNDPNAAIIVNSQKGVPSTTTQVDAAKSAGVVDPQLIEGVNAGMKSIGMIENPLSSNTDLNTLLLNEVTKVQFAKMTPAACATETIKLMTDKLAQLKAGT